MKSLFIKDFYDVYKEKLELELLTTNETLSNKKINTPSLSFSGLSLSGYFTHYNPKEIQIFGKKEYSYLKDLSDSKDFFHIMKSFMIDDIPCIIIGDNQPSLKELILLANENNVPIFSSNLSVYNLTKNLIAILENYFADSFFIFGTLMEIYGLGVLLYGNEGIGKSETALALVSRGHKFIADDKFMVKNHSGKLVGYCNNKQFLLKTGNSGTFMIDRMYGIERIATDKSIDLVINLIREDNLFNDKDEEKISSMKIRGINIPKIDVPIATGKNTQILIEAVVKDFLYRKLINN